MKAILPIVLTLLAKGAPAPQQGGSATQESLSPEVVERLQGFSPLPPPPADPTNRFATDERAAHLGRYLFFDPRFSANGEVSCATCHQPNQGFSDRRRLPTGIAELPRHSMTLWNVAYNRWFFWDGRADSLWAQALQPLEDPREHGSSRVSIAKRIGADPDLRRAYEEVFGDLPDFADDGRFPEGARPALGPSGSEAAWAWSNMARADRDAVNRVFVHVGKALAAYERLLVSRDAPFDRFVAGVRNEDPTQRAALSPREQRGLELFLGKANCHICHAGPGFTDREFHDNRVPPLSGGKRVDAGRYEGIQKVMDDPFNGIGSFSDAPTGAAEDKVDFLLPSRRTFSEFKTPSLRNVALTAPYMHQGQLDTLAEVLHFYNTLEGAARSHHDAEKILQPLGLGEEELADLEAFLHTLTDVDLDPHLLEPPRTPWLAD